MRKKDEDWRKRQERERNELCEKEAVGINTIRQYLDTRFKGYALRKVAVLDAVRALVKP